MGDKQRADCVAAKPGPPAVRGAWGTTGRRREEGEGGRRLSNAINLHSLSLWPAQGAQAAAPQERGRERTPSHDVDTVRK